MYARNYRLSKVQIVAPAIGCNHLLKKRLRAKNFIESMSGCEVMFTAKITLPFQCDRYATNLAIFGIKNLLLFPRNSNPL